MQIQYVTFLTADQQNGKPAPILATAKEPSAWETFTFARQADNSYAIIANNVNKYLAVQADGSLIANVAIGGAIPANALYTLGLN